MLKFEQALKKILKNTARLSPEKILVPESVGYILAERVCAKIDMPPFNKSAMDGYAVKVSDLSRIPVNLKCIGTIQAGQTFKKKIKPGECVKIMTGAVVPNDTDTVIMIENTQVTEKNNVRILNAANQGENVCLKGEDIKKNQKLLKEGKRIAIENIALIAAAGKEFVKVIKKPSVAFLNTGGEIIPAGKPTAKNKIYNGNGPQIHALLKAEGITKLKFLGIAKDNLSELKTAIKKGLNNDILLISGGVSKGDYDLIPSVLKNLGVKEIFHNVKIKPGKPLFFGKYKKTLIFGIPGNPVSNFTTFLLFIKPAIKKMTGEKQYSPRFKIGTLNQTVRQKIGRKHFMPVKIFKKNNQYLMQPVNTHGSADIVSLSLADGFMVMNSDIKEAQKGEKVKFITWKNKF